MIGTEITYDNSTNYEFINSIDNSQTLRVILELGYLDIAPRNTFAGSYATEIVNNPYTPSMGGEKGDSFVNTRTVNRFKSKSLSVTTSGIIPQHIKNISGAPYCTFIEGSLLPDKTHIYYDLIKGPKDAPTFNSSVSLPYVNANPQILSQTFGTIDNPDLTLLNGIGRPYIPSTTKNSNLVGELIKTPVTSYNIWTIDNLAGSIKTSSGGQIVSVNKLENFDYINYLGFVPKSGVQIDNIQPYAQTWSYNDTAQINVYASNAQVQLTRKYPIHKDFAHEPKAKYLIYNSTTETPTVEVNDINLYGGDLSDPNTTPVGFMLNFTSILVSEIPPVRSTQGQAVLPQPRLIVSFGDIDATQDELDKYTSEERIGKYSLDITPGSSPRLYFNVAKIVEATSGSQTPQRKYNDFSIELKSLNKVTEDNNAEGTKVPNTQKIFVYFSGPYMYIGASENSGTWETIRDIKLPVFNTETGEKVPGVYQKFKHYLDSDSKIRIQAQYMNFIYSYGPPLFNPYDDENVPAKTNDLPNTLNNIRTTVSVDGIEGFLTEDGVRQIIVDNAVETFQSPTDDNAFGGATAYHDVRFKPQASDYGVSIKRNGNIAEFKITMPKTLSGIVFNKFMPVSIPEPDITDSYVKYDLRLDGQNINKTVSQILSENITALSVNKALDPDTSSYVKSDAQIVLSNLNRTDAGQKLLQFMRQNVCVVRVSAGYKETYPFFEGMIDDIDVEENLEETKITINASDLLSALFHEPQTMILSTQNMQFPGMFFRNIINSLVYHSELYRHFRYSLGDPLDPTTIEYRMRYDPLMSLPKLADTMAVPGLSQLRVGAYSEQMGYFGVLKTIRDLSIQTNTNLSFDNVQYNQSSRRFDVPVYYWYTNGPQQDLNVSTPVNARNLNGIIMSSRTLEKDGDKFYIRRKNITPEMTSDINELHGNISAEAPFTSKASQKNLMTNALYRFVDLDSSFEIVDLVRPNSYNIPVNVDSSGYVGYRRFVIFDKAESSDLSIDTNISNVVLPDRAYALNFITNWMNAAYSQVYENLAFNAYVTKPLKEWGHFRIYIESDENFIDQIYLYTGIKYDFDINNNVIKTSVNASKQPIQSI